jgi:hypothetical protein
MKIIIIQPTTVFKDGTPYKTPRRWIMGLALPYVAALTPKWVDVELLDDRLSEKDGVWRCFEEFYSVPGILRRFLMPPNGYV